MTLSQLKNVTGAYCVATRTACCCCCIKYHIETVCCEQGSHASWKVLDFFPENSRTWKVQENHFGPGKSWKLKLKVLESPGKYP